jgi:hypothetical protein
MGMTATTTTTTQATTLPTLLDFFAREEMAMSFLEHAKRQVVFAQEELAEIRAHMAECYSKEDIQQGRKEGWGVIRD